MKRHIVDVRAMRLAPVGMPLRVGYDFTVRAVFDDGLRLTDSVLVPEKGWGVDGARTVAERLMALGALGVRLSEHKRE